jgi:hypothetical protein
MIDGLGVEVRGRLLLLLWTHAIANRELQGLMRVSPLVA